MNRENQILNLLLQKYERSKISIEETSKKWSISLITSKLSYFDKYFDTASTFEDIEEYDNAFKSLLNRNFISVKYSGEKVDRVTLNLERINDIYNFTKATPLKDKLSNERKMLLSLKDKYFDSAVDANFIDKMVSNIDLRKSNTKYYESSKELEFLLKAIREIEKNQSSYLLRNFCVEKLGDSKIIENNAQKILSRFNEFSGIKYESFDELLLSHYIDRNVKYLYVKNGLKLKIYNQEIDLDSLKISLCLPLRVSDLPFIDVKKINENINKLITIENLTTFNTFEDPCAVIIYTGGYISDFLVKFISKIHSLNTNITYFHFGDIDYGGFSIFLDILVKTKINFLPYRMSFEEILNHQSQAKKLSDNDVINLNNLKKRVLEGNLDENIKLSILETINLMLKYSQKLEQEAL